MSDYSFAEGDQLAFGAALSNLFGNDAGRVQLQQMGSDVTVQIDTTGAGAWSELATFKFR